MQFQSFYSFLILASTLVLAHPRFDSNVPDDLISDFASNAIVSNDLVNRENCANEECVTFYKDQGYTAGLILGSYKPDYSGYCY